MDSSTQLFRLSLSRQLAISTLFFGLALLVFTVAILLPVPGDRHALLTPAVSLIILALAAWLMCRYQSITISDKGVIIRQLGRTITTPWENVEEVEFRAPAFILLRKPLEQSRLAMSHLLLSLLPRNESAAAPEKGRIISLDYFQHHIDSGELPKTIRRSRRASKQSASRPQTQSHKVLQ